MYSIVVVIHLMSIPKSNSKLTLVCKLIFLLRYTAVYEVSYCLCALYLINCYPNHHNLYHIIWIFHSDYYEQIVILVSFLNRSNITNLIIFKVSISKVPRYLFHPLIPLLDQISHIYIFSFKICNTFGNKNPLYKTTAFPDTNIG